MIIRPVYSNEKDSFNKAVTHPLQSWEWGDFKIKNGAKVKRLAVFKGNELTAGFQLIIHNLPKTKYKIGYLPKCILPDKGVLETLKKIGQEEKLIFIKMEPNEKTGRDFLLASGCFSGRPLFTKYTFQLDLKQTEEDLLAKMKSKTRYNVRLAQKHGVEVSEDNSLDSFNQYLRLTFETTKRQGFYSHDKKYHQQMWQCLYPAGIAHLLKAVYQKQTIASWIIFIFNNTAYYPYGASSREHKEVMASSLMMWEAICFARKMSCHTFDMWGSLGPDAKPTDPWYGFHRFKEGFGPQLVEFCGTFDLVISQNLYKLFNFIDNWRWRYLKIKAKIPFF